MTRPSATSSLRVGSGVGGAALALGPTMMLRVAADRRSQRGSAGDWAAGDWVAGDWAFDRTGRAPRTRCRLRVAADAAARPAACRSRRARSFSCTSIATLPWSRRQRSVAASARCAPGALARVLHVARKDRQAEPSRALGRARSYRQLTLDAARLNERSSHPRVRPGESEMNSAPGFCVAALQREVVLESQQNFCPEPLSDAAVPPSGHASGETPADTKSHASMVRSDTGRMWAPAPGRTSPQGTHQRQ